jgi:hypothetical protein
VDIALQLAGYQVFVYSLRKFHGVSSVDWILNCPANISVPIHLSKEKRKNSSYASGFVPPPLLPPLQKNLKKTKKTDYPCDSGRFRLNLQKFKFAEI